MTVTLTILGRPVPKSRPGRGRAGAFTPKRTRAYENLIAWGCRQERARFGSVPIEVSIELHSATELTGDVDNYAKAVLDGLQKGEAIANDRQVVALSVTKIASLEEKTVVHLQTLEAA